MKTLILENISGDQLPEEWKRQADVQPGEQVEITIAPPRSERVQALLESIDDIGRQAAERGLTEAELTQLLDES